jgi:DNA excision repair protein ERCC-2
VCTAHCLQSRPLLVQAPTGIGKTIGTLYPALRAMPERGTDKLFFLTAKTPGARWRWRPWRRCAVAGRPWPVFPLRVLELVARDKACEHKDKACHGQSCPLAAGFPRPPAGGARAAAQRRLAGPHRPAQVALAHACVPTTWARRWCAGATWWWVTTTTTSTAARMLHAMTQLNGWRVSVLVDEAHNLYSRACSMYSADLSRAETAAVRAELPGVLRRPADEVLNQWDVLVMEVQRSEPVQPWSLLKEPPEAWLRSLQRFNSAVGEYLNDHAADAPGAWLPFFFKTLAFATLAEGFGEHSLCEFNLATRTVTGTASARASQFDLLADGAESPLGAGDEGALTLRNIVPAHFILPRMEAADSMVLFSATLNPADYYINLLGLPDSTQAMDVPCPFDAAQLAVRIHPLSTRRDDRLLTLDALVDVMAVQFEQQPGNYLAFFSSFDYLELAQSRLLARHPSLPVWAQQRQMNEAARHVFLRQFDAQGQGIGFAVLGGVFGEGVDLPGKRLIGAFIATLGLPQFDAVNNAICERMQALFGRGHDYTYLFPGMQKVVQAAGRVIRTPTDTGAVLLLDERYREHRYRSRLPGWWKIAMV